MVKEETEVWFLTSGMLVNLGKCFYRNRKLIFSPEVSIFSLNFSIFGRYFGKKFVEFDLFCLKTWKTGNGSWFLWNFQGISSEFFHFQTPFSPTFCHYNAQNMRNLEKKKAYFRFLFFKFWGEKKVKFYELFAKILLPVEIPWKLVIFEKNFEKLAKKGQITPTFCQNNAQI